MNNLKKPALVLTLLLALFGIFVGGLMTWHHETQLYAADAQQGALIGCEESAQVNCDIVNTSAWSEIGGIPLATLAIPFYATIALLAGLALSGRDRTRGLLVVGGVFSVGLSAVLYSVSKNELGYICAWCFRLYIANFSLLVLSLLPGKPPLPDGRTFGIGVGAFLALNVLAAGGDRAFRHTLTGDGPALAATGGKLTHDPRGKAPARTFTVTTEDNKQTTFSLDPDDAWAGNPDAKVAVVMFGDLECGYCKRSSAEIARLYEAYSDRVLFVFKHFPMNPDCNAGVKNKKHKSACDAAIASVCAQQQGLFWPFHDLAYKNQHQLGPDYLRTYATEVGADGAKYDACIKGDAAEAIVRHDADVGTALDIHGTPRIFINGKLYRSGASAEAMAKQIETELGATAADAVAKAKALHETDDVAAIPADVPATRALSIGGLSFSIDTFEASVGADGKAVSAKHEVPALRSNWYAAKDACEKAGKRLCTEEEWVTACQNARAADDNHNGQFADDMIEGTAYPYGDYHEDGRCWDGKEGDDFRPVYTGEEPGCATPTGVYDMTGNLEEWVGDSPEHAVLLGGAYDTPEDHARCYRRNDTFGPGYASARSGFRCCSN